MPALTLTEQIDIDLEVREQAETKARERAARGAALFDRLFPEWWKDVRLTKLKMATATINKAGCSCVLAQISSAGDGGDRGTFKHGRRLMALAMERPYGITPRMEIFYGINITEDQNRDPVEFRDLTEAWKDEIRMRRALATSTRDIIPA